MAKKKSYYYVLVFTEEGPCYVTSVDYSSKTAFWNVSEKPLSMDKASAEDLAFCLSVNFHSAVMVTVSYELDYQPYRYDFGTFHWIPKEEK